jgi:hypothetical protein
MNHRTKFLASFILAAGSIFASGEDMKLVNTNTGFVVVEFKNGQPLFHDRFLKEEMADRGIAIPPSRKADFEGKDAVFPGDSLFQKAFAEIYVPLSIASPIYQWRS